MDPMQSSVRGRRSSLHADAVITIGGVRPAPPPQTSTQHVCQDEAMVSSGDPSWMSGYSTDSCRGGYYTSALNLEGASIRELKLKYQKLKYRNKPNNCNADDHVNAERSPGRKAEEKKVLARKHEDCDDDPFIEEIKKTREAHQEIERDRKARDDKFYELEKIKLDLKRDRLDTMIMQTDTSAMDSEAKQYFKLMKEEILARRFKSRKA
ncbi:uncharacterized protein [Zea mays]|uniref:uncharacterized protein n=1 Tax=Zea mays TaxID=4577 RepID=UPI0004DEB3EF|nr:uncharacterized protein LOC103653446 [Zea mays]|eukprot:XP_008678572.1 uncharacterized protein LOC103653446 [Zea mays]